MKRKIYKYVLQIDDNQAIEMPEGATILTAQMQRGHLCLWAVVDIDPELPQKMRHIEIIGTGNLFTEAPRRYIATVQDGSLVWHVFERQ